MTENPSAVVDLETFTVRRTISIAAARAAVWSAVTEPELISRWFGEAWLDGGVARPGVTGTLTWPDSGPIPLRVEAVDAPRSITYRWNGDDVDPDRSGTLGARTTVFTFTLEEVDGGTRLTVVETGFETTSDPAANLESHRGGWDAELDELVALVEQGS